MSDLVEVITCCECGEVKPRERFPLGKTRRRPCSTCWPCVEGIARARDAARDARLAANRAKRDRRNSLSCFRCQKRKVREAFPLGPSGKRRSPVCWGCVEEDAYALGERLMARKATWTVEGKRYRRCSKCREVKLMTRLNFFVSQRKGTRDRDGYRVTRDRYSRLCKSCHSKANTASTKRRLAVDPTARLRRREASRRYRERNLEKSRAAAREHKRKLREDPVRWAEYLEQSRINYRLRLERKGVPLDSIKAKADVRVPGRKKTIPAAPLVAFINRIIEQREVVAEVINDPTHASPKMVCEDLGLGKGGDRKYRRWREGEAENVTVALADLVILRAGVPPESVYSLDDHREAFEALTSVEYVAELEAAS